MLRGELGRLGSRRRCVGFLDPIPLRRDDHLSPADLIPPNSGWDLSMNTSSSALAISEDSIIVGTGVHDGETHAYAMVPVAPTPTPILRPHLHLV